MKVYDCFAFNDENHILEIRLNELNSYVACLLVRHYSAHNIKPLGHLSRVLKLK